jgi:hypothetical protein
MVWAATASPPGQSSYFCPLRFPFSNHNSFSPDESSVFLHSAGLRTAYKGLFPDGRLQVPFVFIYNFTKYIQWPATQQSGDFVIAVVGNSPVFDELSKITANKTVGTQKIVVKKLTSAATSTTARSCFVPGARQFRSRAGKAQGQGRAGDHREAGMAKKGQRHNFVMQDNKWKFELNEAMTQHAGLKVSKELAKLAIPVS